jgi:sulfur carrier protein
MIITVNGEAREVSDEATVESIVGSLGAGRGGRGLAVAVGGEVVPRTAWSSTALSDGARVEVVVAVQGG